MIACHPSLIRSYPIAGRTVQISVAALRQDDGSPRFQVTWSPSAPARLTHGDITAFDAFKAQALVELQAEIRGLAEAGSAKVTCDVIDSLVPTHLQTHR